MAERTTDVLSSVNSFLELGVPNVLQSALEEHGLTQPSPVQAAAIPPGLHGIDLVIQSKSGTGKTVAFGVICLSRLDVTRPHVQALILVPTHEIALQVAEVLIMLGSQLPAPGLSVSAFIGGLPLQEDSRSLRRVWHVVVGSPGRVRQLIELGPLKVGEVRLLILDEADNLLTGSTEEDVRWLARHLSGHQQVLAVSATFSKPHLAASKLLMTCPLHIATTDPRNVALLGVRQFYRLVSGTAAFVPRLQALLALLRGLPCFHQAIVFCNRAEEAEWVTSSLTEAGFPAAFTAASKAGVTRMDTFLGLRNFTLRCLVSTDLTARGLDLERVNLVVNLDLPLAANTFMHRVGRTGRFGTLGLCVTLCAAHELGRLHGFLREAAGGQTAEELPPSVPDSLYARALSTDEDRLAFRKLLALQSLAEATAQPAEGQATRHQHSSHPAPATASRQPPSPATAWLQHPKHPCRAVYTAQMLLELRRVPASGGEVALEAQVRAELVLQEGEVGPDWGAEPVLPTCHHPPEQQLSRRQLARGRSRGGGRGRGQQGRGGEGQVLCQHDNRQQQARESPPPPPPPSPPLAHVDREPADPITPLHADEGADIRCSKEEDEASPGSPVARLAGAKEVAVPEHVPLQGAAEASAPEAADGSDSMDGPRFLEERVKGQCPAEGSREIGGVEQAGPSSAEPSKQTEGAEILLAANRAQPVAGNLAEEQQEKGIKEEGWAGLPSQRPQALQLCFAGVVAPEQFAPLEVEVVWSSDEEPGEQGPTASELAEEVAIEKAICAAHMAASSEEGEVEVEVEEGPTTSAALGQRTTDVEAMECDGGTGAVSEPEVSVPVSLVRRYYCLEWEEYRRQYDEWLSCYWHEWRLQQGGD